MLAPQPGGCPAQRLVVRSIVIRAADAFHEIFAEAAQVSQRFSDAPADLRHLVRAEDQECYGQYYD
jgi:hypothetical protein